MRLSTLISALTCAALSTAAPLALADDWDGDDDTYTRYLHDLTHGSDEWHDLAKRPGPVADADHVFVPQDPYTSWEVTIDGLTPAAGELSLDRMIPGVNVLLQTGVAPTTAGGVTRTLWWTNPLATPTIDMIRVQGADCGASCNTRAKYRIRAYETTISVPRFNNSGTQVTVLLVQNTRSIARTGTIYFWDASGNLITTSALSLPAHALTVLNTSSITVGTSGSLTIAHDAGYGGLSAKAIALEPATGFSFDTIGTYKPK